MKIVLSGSTGFIGGEVLTQCPNHPSITSILILTRRRDPGALTAAANPKAKVIVVKHFTTYDDLAINEELKSADAAIWCIGTFNGDEKVDIDYPLSFIEAVKTRKPSGSMTRFRYVHLGGAFTEPPPKKEEGERERALWFYANGRRFRGAAEARVLDSAEDDGGSRGGFEIYLVKPGAVLSRGKGFLQKWVLGDCLSIGIDELGATMVNLAVRGSEERVFPNREVIRHGRKLLEEMSI